MILIRKSNGNHLNIYICIYIYIVIYIHVYGNSVKMHSIIP